MAQWTVQAEAKNVAWLRHEVGDAAELAGASTAIAADVRIALTEAAGNVVRHAYEGRETGLIGVTSERAGGSFIVVVEDAGIGLWPRPKTDGPRLGMALIAAVCDAKISRRDGGGLSVTMRFALD
jgi:anti-sigma regulatory factor (Ser/Thr protein kinase)